MTRVIVFIHSLGRGGTEKFLTTLLPRLVRNGAKITVVTWGRLDLARDLLNEGVELIYLKGGRLAKIYSAMAIIGTSKDAIVHFYLPEAYLIGGLAGVLVGHPRMIMSRRSLNDYQKKHRLLAWIERRLHHRMVALLANCNAVRDQLVAEGAPPDKIGVIYSAVDPRFYGQKSPAVTAR